jgi:hypothetical protein
MDPPRKPGPDVFNSKIIKHKDNELKNHSLYKK